MIKESKVTIMRTPTIIALALPMMCNIRPVTKEEKMKVIAYVLYIQMSTYHIEIKRKIRWSYTYAMRNPI
jgi:hypothetical protein